MFLLLFFMPVGSPKSLTDGLGKGENTVCQKSGSRGSRFLLLNFCLPRIPSILLQNCNRKMVEKKSAFWYTDARTARES